MLCKAVKQLLFDYSAININQIIEHSILAIQLLFNKMWQCAVRVFITSVLALFSISSISYAEIPNDSYIAGYAAGVLKSNFKLELPSMVVRNGVIILPAKELLIDGRAKILQQLSEIPGVIGVEVRDDPIQQADVASLPSEEESSLPRTPDKKSILFPTGLLPTGHLFQSLLADPRWAHFSAAYRNYIGSNLDGNHNGSVSFGETIPFYRANLGQTIIQWETGLQAAVFSDFNLGAESSDLINSDFIASVYGSMRAKKLSAFARIYHQSSHLGDEFLLRTRTSLERINLSYEGADLRFSYDLPYGMRVYGGGGGIFHKEPSTLKPWSVQYGTEFRSPWRIDFAAMRPIMAVDFKNHEQNNWNMDVSARAGVQLENIQTFGRKLQIMIEYFNGNSPTGQFFLEKVEYLGIGAHYQY